MNRAFYQSRRNQGRICEPASWPRDVIKAEDNMPPPGGHDPPINFEGRSYYMPFGSVDSDRASLQTYAADASLVLA